MGLHHLVHLPEWVPEEGVIEHAAWSKEGRASEETPAWKASKHRVGCLCVLVSAKDLNS